jgi:hypothetical protein
VSPVSTRLCGIDFSGDARKWGGGCTKSNVWIAEADDTHSSVVLRRLYRVQDLDGTDHPYSRLSRFLRESGGFVAIDAPFSIPARWASNPVELWNQVASLDSGKRAFASGRKLIELVVPESAPAGTKVYRDTELRWQRAGVNVRSTLWYAPRGGAPFAAAAMTLLSRHDGPVWPFSLARSGKTTLVEAFPAAQLCHWGLPYELYGRVAHPDGPTIRERLVNSLTTRGLRIDSNNGDACIESADALDAVICLFAARAVARSAILDKGTSASRTEGLIAVHD